VNFTLYKPFTSLPAAVETGVVVVIVKEFLSAFCATINGLSGPVPVVVK
jgi:hypothetical protein